MKIVLIGDFSSLHLNLQKGFIALGHQCALFSNGDGFKKIPGGINYGPSERGRLKLITWLIRQPNWLEQLLLDNDIVQLMNPYSLFLPRKIRFFYCSIIIKRLEAARRKTSAKFGLSVAGCSASTFKEMSTQKRSPCAGCITDYRSNKCIYDYEVNYEYEKKLQSLCDCTIPFGGCAYERSATGLPALPIPIHYTCFPYSDNVVSGKVRILHGINREGFKGTRPILKAMERIAAKFNNVEIVIANRMPFNDYLKLVSSCNVVVDQLYGDALGMNAMLSMSLGRIVLSSYDPTCIKKIYEENSPALNISSEETVYATLAELLTSWSNVDFIEAGRRGRYFVESRCDSKSIASRVLDYYAKS